MGRGNEGKSNIFSKLGGVKDAIKDKLSMPTDVVEQTRAAREYGGTRRGTEGEKVVVVDETPVGATAHTLKAADQMTGQTFNDVGKLGSEGEMAEGAEGG